MMVKDWVGKLLNCDCDFLGKYCLLIVVICFKGIFILEVLIRIGNLVNVF